MELLLNVFLDSSIIGGAYSAFMGLAMCWGLRAWEEFCEK